MRNSPLRTEIAVARLAAGLRQKELADRCGVSVTHLQKIELGKREASARIVTVIATLRRAH
jgi:transcriptional regulator with XRE-family HTH domain